MKYIYIYIHITCIPALWNTCIYIYTYISHAFQLYEIHVYIYTYISHAFQLYEIHVYIYTHTYHMHSSSMKYMYIYIHIHITCIPALWNTYIYISSHPQKSCQTFRLLFSCCGRPTRPSPTRVTFLIFAQQLLAETSPVFFGGYHVNSWRPTGFKYVWAPFLRHCFKSLQIAPNRLWSMTYLA